MTSGNSNEGRGWAGVEYFASFSGYGQQLTPIASIAFEETQQSAGYVEVERESQFVAVLRSIGVTRSTSTILHKLEEMPDSTDLVFEALFDPRINEYLVGSEITYEATRSARFYFAGRVEPDGRTVPLRLFRRSVLFADVYDRGENGHLATALHFAADKLPGVDYFGDGESPLPLADQFIGSREIDREVRAKAETLREQAKQKLGMKDYRRAIAELEDALAMVKGGNDENAATLANVLCNLATSWLYVEDYSRAAYFAACGLEMHASRRSIRGSGICTLTLGLIFQNRGLAAQAIECHRQAAQLFLQAADSQSREYALREQHTIESWRMNLPG